MRWAGARRTLSAFAREQGRDLETLKRWVHAYYPEELCKYSNGATDYIFPMHERYHAEAIENAFEDIDRYRLPNYLGPKGPIFFA